MTKTQNGGAPACGRFDLSGRVAVVTGASRGIGEDIALAYADAGAKVALMSRKQEGVDAVAERVAAAGGEALAIACHTGDGEQVQRAVDEVVERWGGVDVLVNNAATNPHYGPVLDAEDSFWAKTFEVNVLGYVHLARSCVPSMRQRGGGKILNVASVAGLRPWPGLGIYSVSKAAVLHLTRQLAAELAGDGIQVNAIAPGLIRTRFSEALWKEEKVRAQALAQIPAGRLGETEDLVGPALFLASSASDFTTGAVFTVDGGQTLGTGRLR